MLHPQQLFREDRSFSMQDSLFMMDLSTPGLQGEGGHEGVRAPYWAHGCWNGGGGHGLGALIICTGAGALQTLGARNLVYLGS